MINDTIVMEKDNKNVDDIKKEIKKLEDDILKIQEDCLHKQYSVKFLGETKEVLKVCDNCGKNLGYPSQQEMIDNGYR